MNHATVTKIPNVRKWLAWCEEHQDGIRAGTEKQAQAWADKHNAERHAVKS